MTDLCSFDTRRLIPIEQALLKIKQTIIPITSCERVPLKFAIGRVLSESIFSSINIPPDRNSAMDGYAFCSSDIKPNQTFKLTLVGTSWAGNPYKGELNKGECIRLYTGAVVPAAADSVIMQEQIIKEAETIIFPSTTIANKNIRQIGGDSPINSKLLSAPKKLTAIDVGLLASAGIYDVPVKRKIMLAFFSTGDELCPIGQPLAEGKIYDSNRYTLNGLLDDKNIIVSDLGVIVDDKIKQQQTLLTAAETYDIIITTGGASVGDADFIKEILDACGEVGFWKIAIKPGKPLAFGKIKNCYFFGLPGNPVSVITTFQKIVSPALQYLSAMPEKKPFLIPAICTDALKKDKGRKEYQRGIFSQDETGRFYVESAGKQDSNIMSAVSKANCYIVLPIESEGVSVGQQVYVEPFELLI